MTTNPTPFVLAENARWFTRTDGVAVLPARVFIHHERTPVIVVSRGKRKNKIVVGESPSSGFSGLMLDNQGRYAGSIRRAIVRQP